MRCNVSKPWVLALVIGALLACREKESNEGCAPEASGGAECATNADCEFDQVCAGSGFCQRCTHDFECGDGLRCVATCDGHMACDECASDSHCGIDRICSSADCGRKRCVPPPCSADDECSDGAYCDGICVAAVVCESDTECP